VGRPLRGRPVIALDIDGTLGDYHGHFRRFAEQYTGRRLGRALGGHRTGQPNRYPEGEFIDDYDGKESFSSFLGISKTLHREVKLAYRQGGLKRSMPAFGGASELTKSLRKKGAELWLCTTRPYLSHDRIDSDTRHWCRRFGIQYDEVIHGPWKYRQMIREVGLSRVVAVVDDIPHLRDQALDAGVRHAYLLARPYNVGELGRLTDLTTAEVILLEDLEKWRINNV
jgi:hypothetical protein